MTNNKQDDLSFYMRIPASKCFTNNVLLTLEGICDHFSFTESSRDRIKKALEAALSNSIESFYKKDPGLFDLHFSVYKNKLMISIEDYLLNHKKDSEESSNKSNSESVRNMLKAVEGLTDGMSFSEKLGRNSCYSMSFNVSYIENEV